MKKSRILVAFGIISFMIYMNYLTPLFADDFSYTVSWVTKEPMTSLKEVLQSQYLHYFTTNGRSVVHFLAQSVLCFGKPFVNVVNGIMFCAFCVLICFHGCGSFRKIENWQILSVFAALWFLTPHFGGSYLWVMGAANYLYSPTLILLYLVPYRYWMNKAEEKQEKIFLKAGLMLAGGVLAGWSNENTSLALIAMIAFVIFCAILCKRKIEIWMWTGFVGSIMGAAMLFLSPAQAKRLEGEGGFGGISEWIERFWSITESIIRNFWILLLLVIAFAVICIVKKKKEWIPAGVFFVGTGIAVYSMIGSPIFPKYVWSSILAFAIIFVMNLWTLSEWKKYTSILAVALVICVAGSCIQILPELIRVKDLYQAREIQIEEAVSTGEELVVERIETTSTYSSYNLFWELSSDPNVWPNTAVANYYGLSAIRAVEE